MGMGGDGCRPWGGQALSSEDLRWLGPLVGGRDKGRTHQEPAPEALAPPWLTAGLLLCRSLKDLTAPDSIWRL